MPKGEKKWRWSYWKLPKNGIIKAVEELTELGVEAEFYNFLDSTSFADQSKKIFKENYDAIVTVPFFTKESNDLLQLAKAKKIPVVFLDTEIELDSTANFIRQNSHKAGMVAARLLYGLVGSEGQYFIVNILNDKGVHANGQQREDGFRAFFKKNDQNVSIQTISHPINIEFSFTKEMEGKLKKNSPKGIFVTNSRSHLIPSVLKKNNIGNTFIVGFDLNEKNVTCLKNDEMNFIINQKPDYQGYAAIKALFNFLTKQDSSELNLDIPVEIIVKENTPAELI